MLRTRFLITEEEPGHSALRWSFLVDGEPRVVEQRVVRIELDGEAWALVLCVVCGKDQLDSDEALAFNLTLARGSVALQAGRFVLRHPMPIAGLCEDELARVLPRVAHETMRLRLRVEGRPRAEFFSCYAD